MILGLNKESKNPGSALNAHSVVPIQLGPTDPQVPLANVEHKQHRCRYDDRVWPVAPTLGIGTTTPGAPLWVNGSGTSAATANTAVFSAPNIGSYTSVVHWGATGDVYWRSASSSGKVILQDTGGNVGIGTTNPAISACWYVMTYIGGVTK